MLPPVRHLRPWVLAAILLAFALRLPLGGMPPGLYRDEAYYGLDAVAVLAGQPALFFPANNGREPLFVYLAAAFIAFLGQTPAALRLASAFVGVATVAAAWAALRPLAGPRAALLAAWLFAVAPWPVLLGRAGFRAGTLPLVLALAVALGLAGWRRGGRRLAWAGGALAGLTLYTYTAARALPLVFLAGGLWLWRREGRPERAWLLHWSLAAALVVAPLAGYFARHPQQLAERLAEVAVLQSEVTGDAPGTVLVHNLVATTRMLVDRGDFIPRHNIPERPVFAPLGGVLAWLGLVAALVWARRRSGLGLLLIWLAVMALPTALAEGAPHFLRAAGLLPAILALPALGAEVLAGLAGRLRPSWSAPAWILVAVALVAGELWASLDYLRRADVAAGSRLYHAFDGGAVDLARDLNTSLGRGWRGGWAAGPDRPGQAVWLDRRLRDGWAALPYLSPESRLTLADPYDPILTRLPGMAYLQPAGLDLDGLWSGLAPRARLDFSLGSMERADSAAEASRLYVRVQGQPAEPVATPLARFGNGMRLLSAGLSPDGAGGVEVETLWDSEAGVSGPDVTAFFQILDEAGLLLTADEPLGSGLYPTPRWRPGDQIAERRRLALPPGLDPADLRLWLGLYVAPDTTPIPRLDGEGRRVQGAGVELPLAGLLPVTPEVP